MVLGSSEHMFKIEKEREREIESKRESILRGPTLILLNSPVALD